MIGRTGSSQDEMKMIYWRSNSKYFTILILKNSEVVETFGFLAAEPFKMISDWESAVSNFVSLGNVGNVGGIKA